MLLLFLMTGCGGCGDVCPPDEKVGELELHTDVRDFISYSGSENLIFQNQNGDSLMLFSGNGKETSRDRLCVKDICTEPEIKGNTTCEFFESETERFIFRNADQTALLDFLAFSELIRPETELFRQTVRVSWNFRETLFGTGELVLKIIPDMQIDPSEFNVSVLFEPIGDLELNGKLYTDAFKAQDSQMNLYLNAEDGLIGFETSDEVWNLISR